MPKFTSPTPIYAALVREKKWDISPIRVSQKDRLENMEWSITASDKEYNQAWIDFEKDMTPTDRKYYVELSQQEKQNAFDYWKQSGGVHWYGPANR